MFLTLRVAIDFPYENRAGLEAVPVELTYREWVCGPPALAPPTSPAAKVTHCVTADDLIFPPLPCDAPGSTTRRQSEGAAGVRVTH